MGGVYEQIRRKSMEETQKRQASKGGLYSIETLAQLRLNGSHLGQIIDSHLMIYSRFFKADLFNRSRRARGWWAQEELWKGAMRRELGKTDVLLSRSRSTRRRREAKSRKGREERGGNSSHVITLVPHDPIKTSQQ
ncbi:unnamed protein product [Laminaria digitata]